jgi:integrase
MPRARAFRRKRRLPDGSVHTDRWFSVEFDAPDGRRIAHLAIPRTTSAKVADEILQREMAAAWGPGGGAKPGNGKTVGDLLESYEKYLADASPSTWKDKKSWIHWWQGRFGARPADQLRAGEIEEALLELRKTRKEATVAGYLGVLRPALRRGLRDGHIGSDPTLQLSVSFGYPERHVLWSDDELRRTCAAAPAWCSGLLCFLRASGLRIGDALTLRWDQVEEGRLRLLQGQEKTDEPLDVPLSRKAVAVLETIPRAGPLVFPGPRKGPRAYNRVLRVIQTATAAADPPVVGKTPHDLRRSWAVELLEAGTSLELIAALLGQRTTRVAGRYAKARYSALEALLARLPS